MLKDFKAFLLRGNVVDLAVAVVIGAAFNTVVQGLVKNIITPLIAAIGGQPDFSGLKFTVNNSQFLYGETINQVISFMIIAAVVFFFVVQPMNKLVTFANRRDKPEPAKDKPSAKDPQLVLLEEIRDLLKSGDGNKSKPR